MGSSPPGTKLGDAYQDANPPIVRRRLDQGGSAVSFSTQVRRLAESCGCWLLPDQYGAKRIVVHRNPGPIIDETRTDQRRDSPFETAGRIPWAQPTQNGPSSASDPRLI
jgi:hypothetical protein